MLKLYSYVFLLALLSATGALAADNGKAESPKSDGGKASHGKADSSKQEDSEPKEISGMSIVGNNETPTSLVIVPWKSSEIGQETKLKSNLLDDDLTPVDRPVFMRELGFYKLSNPD
jgi:hypothetical protein